jgi:adenylate cyclase
MMGLMKFWNRLSRWERITHVMIVSAGIGAYLLVCGGERAWFSQNWLRQILIQKLQARAGQWTDFKNSWGGPLVPKSKIVIVEIDNVSLNHPELGRWPWTREKTEGLFSSILLEEPRVLGVDIIFSEASPELPKGVRGFLKQKQRQDLVDLYDVDQHLADYIREERNKIVLGWMTEQPCVPRFDEICREGVMDPNTLQKIPPGFERYSVPLESEADHFEPQQTTLRSAIYTTQNIPRVLDAARHNASIDAIYDADALIRRVPSVTMWGGSTYPSLALEMAAVGRGEALQVRFNRAHQLVDLHLGNQSIPVNAYGHTVIRPLGPAYTFQYVSALQLLGPDEKILVGSSATEGGRELKSRSEIFNDAYVFLGISALALSDFRATHFDPYIPGVEVHANTLENILQNDLISNASQNSQTIWLLALFYLAAAILQLWIHTQLSPRRNLLFVAGWILFWSFLDFALYQWKGFETFGLYFLLQSVALGIAHTTFQYVAEERRRKQIKTAFEHYLSPSMVAALTENPTLLRRGVERKELTLLFADLRNFTETVEALPNETLAKFINEFHSLLSAIIFKHGGTVDKYIGDAVMAFWGAPLPNEQHAQKATRALAEIADELFHTREHFRGLYGFPLEVGAALHTGIAGVGNVGSETFFNYTAIGDNVNLCARLESLTKQYKCRMLMSGETRKQLQNSTEDGFYFLHLDTVRVKGRQARVEVHQFSTVPFPQDFLASWQMAQAAYQSQNWRDAFQHFRQAQQCWAFHYNSEGHGPSILLKDRCQEFTRTPPGPEWDGIWNFLEK